MELTIDVREALNGLEQAVDLRGDHYIYVASGNATCRNWHIEDDEPGCIVGTALFKLGVSAELLRENYSGGIVTMAERLGRYGITITEEAVRTFYLAQCAQDRGAPWGAAAAVARAYADMAQGQF